jgi:hypothetical protein
LMIIQLQHAQARLPINSPSITKRHTKVRKIMLCF